MPYTRLTDLPDAVQKYLPQHAQEIYLEAYNSAWEDYADPDTRRDDASREETAHRVAWGAVKLMYEKDEETGMWRHKGRKKQPVKG